MINSILLAVEANVPSTPTWSISIGVVMIVCNILGILLVRLATQNRGSQPSLGGIVGIPQLLAGTSFGHVLGAGVILGLTSIGTL